MKVQDMVDATSDTSELTQMVNFSSHITHLMVETNATKHMIDDDMESSINNELVKTSFLEDESQEEDVKVQSHIERGISEFDFKLQK